ncbi:hypothetical protein [Mesoterricola silvestris]|uniref:Uncharacterized protein n=1 Tax=Mesoterricola silvestris TaxID=2927979 RepID=A0AA48KA36_9BACT|nr:hypothetical protein [Mesoterricola silvestris]BDU72922.1 hypothetical protein METEAL_20960 [Mesoterricola silvestris]
MTLNGISWKIRLVALGALALECLAIGFSAQSCKRRESQAGHIQQADQHQAAQTEAGASAGVHEQGAQDHEAAAHDLNPTVHDADALVDEAQGTVDHLANLGESPGPGQQAGPPIQDPVEHAALDVAKDHLIDVLKQDVAAIRAQNLHLIQADLERQAQAGDLKIQVGELQAENRELRAALASQPRERVWAASAIYGTNGTAGAGVTRSFGPLQAGIDVVRRKLDNGQSTLEALGRVSWSF